ncbi:unnamed protein product [Ectocarpus sp. 12 AP-2014]
MYKKFKRRREKEENGSRDYMVVGQASPMGRYPSTGFQVRALLEHVDVQGGVLDCCGAGQDAVSTVLTARGLRVATNDLSPSLVADTHLDASTDDFAEAYLEDTRRPDWVVTSPPYKNAFFILKQALRVGRVGVAFKLRLTFLEPVKSRGRWLKENPPDRIVMLPRARYRGRKCSSTEAWFVWEAVREEKQDTKPAICFSLPG